jgi:hypothetical protein
MKHYKKPLTAFLGLLILAILYFATSGCGRKPVASSVTEIKESIKQQNDSTVVTDNNPAIADLLNIWLGQIKTGAGKDCDSLCQEEINRILTNAQTEKQSGDNRYQVLYNEKLKLLQIIANMAATSNKTTTVSNDKQTDTSEKKAEKIPVPYVPDFWRYSAYLGFLAAIYFIIRVYDRLKLWATKKQSL